MVFIYVNLLPITSCTCLKKLLILLPGNAKKHILYHVDRTRDGSTYSSRAIKATQDSVPIFTMQASFKMEESDPLKHQYIMPVVPGPEELVESYDFLQLQLE